MDLVTNPIILSVVLLCALCLARVNVLLSLIIAAATAGVAGGLGLTKSMELLAQGFSSNATTALSYILLGTFAIAIAKTGLMQMLVTWIGARLGGRRMIFCLAIAFIACLSQNVVPVHIAFIPLLIPPLLSLMNRMQLDRRAVACALGFGLTAPYISLPIGFGLIFQGIVADSMTQNGMAVSVENVASVAWMAGLAMFAGLLASLIAFSRPRRYEDRPLVGASAEEEKAARGPQPFGLKHAVALAAIAAAVAVQIALESLPLAALFGLIIMLAGRAIEFKRFDDFVAGGISMMGFIAFVMLIAGGYANILKATGAVPALVQAVVPLIGDSSWAAAAIISFIGLLVTMGIGTSFGTVPILAVIYVPLCQAVGFSVPATILLMTIAGALGDAGSPASDSTLGPTSGLNADGQHSHIWDTCVPTFLVYNVPLILAGIIIPQFI